MQEKPRDLVMVDGTKVELAGGGEQKRKRLVGKLLGSNWASALPVKTFREMADISAAEAHELRGKWLNAFPAMVFSADDLRAKLDADQFVKQQEQLLQHRERDAFFLRFMRSKLVVVDLSSRTLRQLAEAGVGV